MHYLTNLTALNDEGCLYTLAGINQISAMVTEFLL